MIKEYGVKDVKVQEVYSLDFDYLKAERYYVKRNISFLLIFW